MAVANELYFILEVDNNWNTTEAYHRTCQFKISISDLREVSEQTLVNCGDDSKLRGTSWCTRGQGSYPKTLNGLKVWEPCEIAHGWSLRLRGLGGQRAEHGLTVGPCTTASWTIFIGAQPVNQGERSPTHAQPWQMTLNAVSSFGLTKSGKVLGQLKDFSRGLSKMVRGQSTCPISRCSRTGASSAWKRGEFRVHT